MPNIKRDEEIKIMTEGGAKSRKILDTALLSSKEGITTLELDKIIEEAIKKEDGTAWFKDVENYSHSSCISVNDEWIHGIPSNYKLKKDDIVKIDIGFKYKEYCLDNCWTISINDYDSSVDLRKRFKNSNKDITIFLEKGVIALENAINAAKKGKRVGDVAYKMQEVEQHGYNVIKNYSGHGIGKDNWEDPQVPCYGVPGTGDKLHNNMVLAIEIMYTLGTDKNVVADDGFTIKSEDNSITAMFEHTVVVKNNSPCVLT